MTRINHRCLARQLKEHWLSAPSINVTSDDLLELPLLLLEYIWYNGCAVTLKFSGGSEQPYDNVQQLRNDYLDSGVVLYRRAAHPIGPIYDYIRAYHDIVHHCHLGFCFGFPGEIASAAHVLELVNILDGLSYGPQLRNPDAIVNHIMSDVAAPNASYFVDGGWGDYDYTKQVAWPRHLVSQVIELGKHYAKTKFSR